MLSILNFQITISLYPGSGTVFSQFIYIFLAVCSDRGELFFAISHFTTVRKHWKGALKLRDREIHAKLRKKWYWYREENNQVILLSWKYNVIYKLLNTVLTVQYKQSHQSLWIVCLLQLWNLLATQYKIDI